MAQNERSVARKSSTERFSGRKSIVIDGMIECGRVPPPTLPVPMPIVIRAGNPCRPSEHRSRARAQFVFRNLKKRECRDFAGHLVEMKIDGRLHARRE